MFRTHSWLAGLTMVVASLLAARSLQANSPRAPRQPHLGFSGHLVKVDDSIGGKRGLYGMEVDSVRRGSPAWEMGLERGDVIITIDNVAFRSRDGYLRALRLASRQPSFVIRNVRTGKLVRDTCELPHEQEEGDPDPPDTYWLAID